MREHHEVDEKLRIAPVGWTILKPHLFLQNLLRAADAVRSDRRLLAPMGSIRLPLVDTRDVGAAAAVVLSDPGAHAGKEYALTGPVAVNYGEVASALTTVAGHEVAYEAVEADEFEARLRAAGIPDWRAYDLAHIASAYGAADNVVSADLAKLLGRQAKSLSQFLEDHRIAYSD